MEKKKYYCINKRLLWSCIILIICFWCATLFVDGQYQIVENRKDITIEKSTYVKYGEKQSELANIEDCYLCGSANRSVASSYGGYDTIGIIDFQEWNILDLRLQIYDSNGNLICDDSGTDEVFGRTEKFEYTIESIPIRGMAEAEVKAKSADINEKLLTNHLCQDCLNKVTKTLGSDVYVNGEIQHVPFGLVDYKTMELYSLQRDNSCYYVRDYRIEILRDDAKVKVQVYHQPKTFEGAT